jgi:hypothetical protein
MTRVQTDTTLQRDMEIQTSLASDRLLFHWKHAAKSPAG